MLEWIMGGVLIAMALFIVIAVMMQSSKDKQLSGTITGSSSDTYLGKGKGRSKDKILSRLTMIVVALFAILVVAMYVIVSK